MIDFICPNCGQINLDSECMDCSGQADDFGSGASLQYSVPKEF
jgi:hypothetical protein